MLLENAWALPAQTLDSANEWQLATDETVSLVCLPVS